MDPISKLGHLVKDMKVKSLDEIYLFSLPIKESVFTERDILGSGPMTF